MCPRSLGLLLKGRDDFKPSLQTKLENRDQDAMDVEEMILLFVLVIFRFYL